MTKASWITSLVNAEPDRLRPSQLRSYPLRIQAKHGENQRQRCEDCKVVMRVMRREAHPILGPLHELQTYICAKCGAVKQVTTESPGAVQ
jgi:uncharacterized protein with PIN domain